MTEEWLHILDSSEQLARTIVQSELAHRYELARQAVYDDVHIREQIEQFLTMKERYEEVQRFGKYHPDYREVMMAVRRQKRELDLNEKVAAYRQAETALQQLLDEVSVIVAHSISKAVQVVSSNPFFETTACGTGCSTGGACNCSVSS